MNSFEDFRKSILKVNGKRHHKIKNSLGVKDAYLWCRKNKLFNGGEISEKDFYRIIRTVNKLLAEELLQGRDITFPQRMGGLEVRRFEPYVKFVNGKVKTTRGIDWKATLQLWHEDEEARKEKFLIHSENPFAFLIFYNRMIANYANKTIYQFRPNRELSTQINKLGKEGIIDAFKIGV